MKERTKDTPRLFSSRPARSGPPATMHKFRAPPQVHIPVKRYHKNQFSAAVHEEGCPMSPSHLEHRFEPGTGGGLAPGAAAPPRAPSRDAKKPSRPSTDRNFSGQSLHEIMHPSMDRTLLPPSPRSLVKQGHEPFAHFVLGGTNPEETWFDKHMTHKRKLRDVLAREESMRHVGMMGNISGPGAHILGTTDETGRSVTRSKHVRAAFESDGASFRMDTEQVRPHAFDVGRAHRVPSRYKRRDNLAPGSLVVLTEDAPFRPHERRTALRERDGHEIHGVVGFALTSPGRERATRDERSALRGPAPGRGTVRGGPLSARAGQAPRRVVAAGVTGSPVISVEQQRVADAFWDRRN